MSLEVSIKEDEVTRALCHLAVQMQRELGEEATRPTHKLIVLAGPTAAGKSELAVKIAQAAGGEIISADSMQVYRGMDIGSAKPTAEQRANVVHHLLDIRAITQPFNVVDFYYEAACACQNVLSRNRVAIVVGGSGFYLHTLLYGPPAGPPSVGTVRKALEEEMERQGVDVLFERLKAEDPAYAETITCRDKQKIVRALEIMQLTRRKVSGLRWQKHAPPVHYEFRCWFLHRPKKALYERIDRRCDEMIASGLIDEVRELEKQGLRTNHAASQSIGYRQALAFLDSPQSSADYETFVRDFKKATKLFVKRQFTWFRKEPLFRWLDVEAHDAETVVDMVLADYYA